MRLEKYLIIRNYYETLQIELPKQTLEEPVEEQKEETESKILIYSRSDINIYRTRLISDMDDIPQEYYDTIYTLIESFKQGTLSKKEIKALSQSNTIKGLIELRYDQVRIALKHVRDNIYVVLGAFAKKADNDIFAYETIAKRSTPNINTEESLNFQLELSEQTEKELKELVETHGRKGTR